VDAFGGSSQDSGPEDPWSISSQQPQDPKARAHVPRDISSQHSMRPFVPPPAPQLPPQDRAKVMRARRASAKERKWTTTITLTESISSSGKKTYYASGTPLERLPMKQPPIPTVVIQEPTRMSYLQRRRSRRISIREGPSRRETTIMAISVKRQRKLKMKKKKYKKLMKRTRSLRKKLGKI